MPGVSEGANFWHLGEETADRGAARAKTPWPWVTRESETGWREQRSEGRSSGTEKPT